MNNHKLVSIIISNYNGKEHLRECLLSLDCLNYPNYEVIVVDAESTDGAPDMVEKDFPKVKLIRKGKIGIGEAINIGINLANGELIVFDLNNDDVVDKNWLNSLVAVIESSDDIGIVCGKRYTYSNKKLLDSAGGKINFYTGETPVIGQNRLDSVEFSFTREVDYVGVILTKRSVIEKVGLVDPVYFIYYEDADFCLRVKRAGYKVVYVPSAIFWHKGSSTVGKSSYKGYYYLVRNEIRFILKNFRWPFVVTSLFHHILIKNILDPLLTISLFKRLLTRLFPRFVGYIQSRSDPTLCIARKEAYFWNLKNLRNTLYERSLIFKRIN